MPESDEFQKFLSTITKIEKQREFDRKVDRLKKSSSATTFWAIFPALFGFHGIAHFYLNRPIEGLIILITGLIPVILLSLLTLVPFALPFLPFTSLSSFNVINFANATYWINVVLVILRIGFFIGNIIHARYQYSRYDFYIHHRAQKPWDNWGLNSLT
jgi:hypothetical protein